MKDKLRLLAEQTGNPALGTFSLDDLTENNVLVYSEDSKIYVLEGAQSIEIAERDNYVLSLASHDGMLYDCGGDRIFETFSGEKIAERANRVRPTPNSGIDERANRVRSLVSHDSTLYDGGDNGEIYETLTGNKIAKRNNRVHSLVSHNGELYDCGSLRSLLFETLTGERFGKMDGAVKSLVSHNGVLYSCGINWVSNTLTRERIVKTERNNEIWSLVSHDGMLYCSGNNGIFETLSGDKICDERMIRAMASVPRSIFVEAGILEQKVRD